MIWSMIWYRYELWYDIDMSIWYDIEMIWYVYDMIWYRYEYMIWYEYDKIKNYYFNLILVLLKIWYFTHIEPSIAIPYSRDYQDLIGSLWAF